MKNKRQALTFLLVLVPVLALYGAAGRPEDGFLAFVLILGLLGIILGVLYLIDYIKLLVRRINEIKSLFTEDGGDFIP